MAIKDKKVLRFRQRVPPENLVGLIASIEQGEITRNTGKSILQKMYDTGKNAEEIRR